MQPFYSPVKGALIIGAVSLIALLTEFLPLISMPFLVLAWMLGMFAICAALVFPALYCLTASFGTRLKSYPKIVAATVLCIAGLNAWYLSNGWAYGLKWQGTTYTYAIVILNLICFGVVGAYAIAGVRRDSTKEAQAAHLGLFLLLSCVAFPVLGELP